MKAGKKIALFYTLITGSIICVVIVMFYLITSGYINKIYFSYLTDKAFATAEKNWEKDEVDEEGYALIQQRYEQVLPVATEILLNADSVAETRERLAHFMTDKEIESLYNGRTILFRYENKMGSALFYPDNEGNFIVLILSANQYGTDITRYIGWFLLITLIISTLLIYLVGKSYSTRMIDRIDSAYKSEKDFISNASHELNNPLTAIQGECEITLLKERTPQEYQSALKRIASETNRIIQLMKHLLFLSHGEKEILKNTTQPVMLADFLMQFVDNRVRFSPDGFGFAIEANPHLLKIAISNLVNNALKYSGNEIVEIRLRDNVLDIIDKGIGIPADEINKIYQPFFRGSNTREYPGNGIGLSLSLQILKIYGARIDVLSDLESGTIIKIYF